MPTLAELDQLLACRAHRRSALVEKADATPVQVRAGCCRTPRSAPARAELRVRLRAHHGLGLVNALVAMKSGVRHFDTTLDGCRASAPARPSRPAIYLAAANSATRLHRLPAPSALSKLRSEPWRPPHRRAPPRRHDPRRAGARRPRRAGAAGAAGRRRPGRRRRAPSRSGTSSCCATPGCSAWSCPRSTAASAAPCATSPPPPSPWAPPARRPRWPTSSTTPAPRAACCRWRRSRPGSSTTTRCRSCGPSPRRCSPGWPTGVWLANFASESVKSSGANIAIATTATPASATACGWSLNGEKSFGCATGVADNYLVTARLDGHDDGGRSGPVPGPPRRRRASARGPPGTAWACAARPTTASRLDDVFIPADEALTVPGAFVKMLQCSRGSFVGNQLAITAVYVGARAERLRRHARPG